MRAAARVLERDLDRLLRPTALSEVSWRGLAVLWVAGGLVYGAVLGSFGLRPWQALYSAIKVPALLAVATAVSLPSFLILNLLLGLREDLTRVLRGVLAAQSTVAVALAALAPVVVVAYVSSDHYPFAIVANGALFALATLAGQRTLSRHYRPLIERDHRHRVGRVAWVSLYVFVAIQSAWILRPFVGAPGLETRFLRPELWRNAYVVVFHDLCQVLQVSSPM